MKVLYLALNDLRLLFRDKMAFFWVLGFPIMYAFFFGLIFSGGSGSVSEIKLAVVDLDQSERSIKFVNSLKSSDAFNVYETTPDSAFSLVKRGKKSAFVVIREGFGEQSFFSPSDSAYVEIGIDPARKMTTGFIEGIITQKVFQQFGEMFTDPSAMKSQIDKNRKYITGDTSLNSEERNVLTKLFSSLDGYYGYIDSLTQNAASSEADSSKADELKRADQKMMSVNIARTDVSAETEGPRSSFEIMFPLSIFWGLLSCAATFATSIVKERVRGTYARLKIAPISDMQILGGKGLACFIACVSIAALLLIMGNIFVGVRIANLPLLVLAVFSASFCFVGIMMALSVLGKTEQSVSGGGWAIMMVMAMLGGAMVPLVFMPSWMQTFSNVSPIKWGIVAIEGAIWRGFTFSDMILPVSILISIGLITFWLGQFILKRSDV